MVSSITNLVGSTSQNDLILLTTSSLLI